MGKTRRNVGDIKGFNRDELYNRLLALPSKRDRALLAFIYLTGCRISEITGKVKKIYIAKKKIPEVSESVDLVGVPLYSADKITKVEKGKGYEFRTLKLEPIMKEDVLYMKEKGIILVRNVPCLKWRSTVPRRNIPIKVESEKKFIQLFLDYYNELPDNRALFPMSRQRAWQIVQKNLGIYTHYLIHQRCTDLVTLKGLTDMYLKQFRGWKDTRPAEVYTHLKWDDLANKM